MFKQRFKTSVEGSPQKLLFFHIIIRDIKFIDWVTKTAPKRVTADFWLALRNANSIKWWCSKTHKILGFQCTVLNVQHLLIVYLLLFDSPTTDLTVLLSSSRSIYCPLNALVRTLSFSSFRPGLKGLFAHSQGNPCVCEIHECPQIHKTSPKPPLNKDSDLDNSLVQSKRPDISNLGIVNLVLSGVTRAFEATRWDIN